jgi:phosphodiesterase/alkaline phosphatase D-like protein
MAYASCNGFSSLRDMKKIEDKNALWTNMSREHEQKPFHLLLMGGDQVYADSIWETVPSIIRWAEKSWGKRKKAKFTQEMHFQVQKFYFDLYCTRWAQAEPAKMLARVPTLMMWDDHDIFDGWGSYPEDQQTCMVYRGIFKQAREHFRVFQLRKEPEDMLGADPNNPDDEHFKNPPSLSHFRQLGNIAIAALDMRSQRTQYQVLGEDSWEEFLGWMNGQEELQHLLVMSSIPVVHPDFSMVEALLGILPGQQDLEDDLKDHWHSRTHKSERMRFIHRLLEFSAEKKTRVTLLSGDVHVAAIGVIESMRSGRAGENANVINQLTSSAIVHPPPPGIVLHGLELFCKSTEDVDRGITARMLKFPGARHRLIGARNWLSLDVDDKERIWANWHVEKEEELYTKVIHRVH